METRLWTPLFLRISLAQFSLFASLYTLFPLLPLELSKQTARFSSDLSWMFLCFAVGLLAVGPFHAYLSDAYKRTSVFLLSCLSLQLCFAGFFFVEESIHCFLLAIGVGMAFGSASASGVTLATDAIPSGLRERGNRYGLWFTRSGMVAGIVLGVMLNQYHSFLSAWIASVALGCACFLLAWGVHLPFRAPMISRLCTFDRFLLLRSWLPAMNLLCVTTVVGLFVSPLHSYLNNTVLAGVMTPFFLWIWVGCLVTRWIWAVCKGLQEVASPILTGFVLFLIGLYWLQLGSDIVIPALLIGSSLGLIIPTWLQLLTGLSSHCERVTVSTTHQLMCELGVSFGLFAAAHFHTSEVLLLGKGLILSALLLFVLVSLPVYRKERLR